MQVVTRKMEKEQRIADLQRLAESIGLRWGGVAKGNKVTVYFNDSPHTMRNLLDAETMIFCCMPGTARATGNGSPGTNTCSGPQRNTKPRSGSPERGVLFSPL